MTLLLFFVSDSFVNRVCKRRKGCFFCLIVNVPMNDNKQMGKTTSKARRTSRNFFFVFVPTDMQKHLPSSIGGLSLFNVGKSFGDVTIGAGEAERSETKRFFRHEDFVGFYRRSAENRSILRSERDFRFR